MEWTMKPSQFGGIWYEGYVDGYFVYARVFQDPSKFGINDGRISALIIAPHQGSGVRDALVNYDPGYHGFRVIRKKSECHGNSCMLFPEIHDNSDGREYPDSHKHRR